MSVSRLLLELIVFLFMFKYFCNLRSASFDDEQIKWIFKRPGSLWIHWGEHAHCRPLLARAPCSAVRRSGCYGEAFSLPAEPLEQEPGEPLIRSRRQVTSTGKLLLLQTFPPLFIGAAHLCVFVHLSCLWGDVSPSSPELLCRKWELAWG